MKRITVLLAMASLLAAGGALADGIPEGDESTWVCPETIYRGFDSRLQVLAIGRLPATEDPIVGFEVHERQVVVALPHRLLTFDGESMQAKPSLAKIEGLLSDAEGRLWIRSSKGDRYRSADGETKEGVLPQASRLVNSGHRLFLAVEPAAAGTRFSLEHPQGGGLDLGEIPGEIQAMSWNSEGLAVIADENILGWAHGDSSLFTVTGDIALRSALDVVLVGERRVVLGLGNAVVLLTGSSSTVLVGFGARLRWSEGALYMLDERSGFIWAVEGIEDLGDPARDKGHAKELVQSLVAEEAPEAPGFLEAARLVGCDTARTWLASGP